MEFVGESLPYKTSEVVTEKAETMTVIPESEIPGDNL